MLLKRKLLTRKLKTRRKRRKLQRQQKRKRIERKEQRTEREIDGKIKRREIERHEIDGGLSLVLDPGPDLGQGGQGQGLEAGPEGVPGLGMAGGLSQGAPLEGLDPEAWIVLH